MMSWTSSSSATYGFKPVLMSKTSFKREKLASEAKLVPNIVHFIHLRPIDSKTSQPVAASSTKPMPFLSYVSYLSVQRFIKPRYIFLFGDALPHGEWWNRTINNISNIYFVNVTQVPSRIYGKPIPRVEHRADVLRYQIMYELGGIYLDPDVLVLKSFEPLRNYSFTMGRESFSPNAIANGIILARPGAMFLRIWITTYRTFNPDQWGDHSILMPGRLHELFPRLIHVEDDTMIKPHTSRLEQMFGNQLYDWSPQYTTHVWTKSSYKVPSSPDEIKKLDSTLGQMMRHIYFGQKGFVD